MSASRPGGPSRGSSRSRSCRRHSQDVVGDLERDPEQAAVVASAAAEHAGGLEQLAGLERAALDVALDRRLRIVPLAALQGLPARERERRLSEHGHRIVVALGGERDEGAREQVIPRRLRGGGAVLGPRGGTAPPHPGPVDQIVVHEGRHVDELDGNTGRDRCRRPDRRGQEREHRPQALAARGERFGSDLPHEAGVPGDRTRQLSFDDVEVVRQPGSAADGVERGAHRAVPVCRATMVPPSSRKWTSLKAAAPTSAARSSAPGNRRTLAGRYV